MRKQIISAMALLVSSSAFAYMGDRYEFDALRRLNVQQEKKLGIGEAMERVAWAEIAADRCTAMGRLSWRDVHPRFKTIPEALRLEMTEAGVPETEFESDAFKDLHVATYKRILEHGYLVTPGSFCAVAAQLYAPGGQRHLLLDYVRAEGARN